MGQILTFVSCNFNSVTPTNNYYDNFHLAMIVNGNSLALNDYILTQWRHTGHVICVFCTSYDHV
jgi:hypothetical protein